MNLRPATWLCIDTETTGLTEADRIVELGAVLMRSGQPIWQLSMLVNPGIPIPEEASAVHGIRDEHVSRCMAISGAWPFLAAALHHADVLVGYNWPFDAAFLTREIPGFTAAIDRPEIDPLVLVRSERVGKFWKGSGRHRLDAVAERLQIAREGDSHRALSDSLLTCCVLQALLHHLPEDAREASAWIAAQREQQERDRAAWLASTQRAHDMEVKAP